MLVHRSVALSIKFLVSHLYTWLERGAVRVKCLAQQHTTVTPARAETQTMHFKSSVLTIKVGWPSVIIKLQNLDLGILVTNSKQY